MSPVSGSDSTGWRSTACGDGRTNCPTCDVVSAVDIPVREGTLLLVVSVTVTVWYLVLGPSSVIGTFLLVLGLVFVSLVYAILLVFDAQDDHGYGDSGGTVGLVDDVPYVGERGPLYAGVATVVFAVAVPIASWVYLRSGILDTFRVLAPFLFLAAVAGISRRLGLW